MMTRNHTERFEIAAKLPQLQNAASTHETRLTGAPKVDLANIKQTVGKILRRDGGILRGASTYSKKGIKPMNNFHSSRKENSSMISRLMQPVHGFGSLLAKMAFVPSAKFTILLPVALFYLIQISTASALTSNVRMGWVDGHFTGTHNELYRPGPLLEYDNNKVPQGHEIILEYNGVGDLPTQSAVTSVCCGHPGHIEYTVIEQKYSTVADRNAIDTDLYIITKSQQDRRMVEGFKHGTEVGRTGAFINSAAAKQFFNVDGPTDHLIPDVETPPLPYSSENLVPFDHPVRQIAQNRERNGASKSYLALAHSQYYTLAKGLTYGRWAFNRNEVGNCGNLHKNNDGVCRFMTFIPNLEGLKKLKAGDMVRSMFLYWDKGEEFRHVIVRIIRTENSSIAWTDDNAGRIEGRKEDGEFLDLNGKIEVNSVFPRLFTFEAREVSDSETIDFVGGTSVIREEVAEFTGSDIGVGETFKYGTWWIERNVESPRFLFRPKRAVDDLPAGEVATSTLVFSLGEYAPAGNIRETSRVEITATIVGTAVPVVSFAETEVIVDESVDGKGTINIVLDSDIDPTGAITINYSAHNVVGDYLDTLGGTTFGNSTIYQYSTFVTFTEFKRKFLSILQVATLAGESDFESNGAIHVQLEDGIGYKLPADSPEKTSITVEMRDRRWPAVSIRSDKTVLTEGVDELTVVFESDIGRHDIDFNVYYSVSQGDHEFIDPANVGSDKFVILEQGRSAVKRSLSIPIVNDEVQEEDGEVVVRLLENPNMPDSYNIGENTTIVFTVKDDDGTTPPVSTDLVTFAWATGSSGDISFANEFSIPSFVVGNIEDTFVADNVENDELDAISMRVKIREEKFNSTGTKLLTFSESVSTSALESANFSEYISDEGFSGYPAHPNDGTLESRIGTELEYGVWYFKPPTLHSPCSSSAVCTNILFLPNVTNLKTLGTGESVKSTFRYQSVKAGESQVEEVSVTLRRVAATSIDLPIVSLEAPAFTPAPGTVTVTARIVRPEAVTPELVPVTVVVEWTQGPNCDRAASEIKFTIPADASMEESREIRFVVDNETFCPSMIATLKPSASYHLDTNAFSVRVIDDSDTHGIYISASKSTMYEGESFNLALNTNAWNTPVVNVRQDLSLSWRPAGLVTRVCGQFPRYFQTSTTCEGASGLFLGALETISSELNHITIETSDEVLADVNGIITATLVGEEQECCAIHPTNSSVSVIVLKDDQRQQQLSPANLSAFTQLGGAIGSQSLNTVEYRVEQAFAEDRGISFELGGNSTIDEFLHAGLESVDQGLQSWQEVFGDSSFEVGLFPEAGRANPATFWGLGDYRPLHDNDALDGNVFTGHFGFDATVGEGMIAGLATSIAVSELDYESGDDLIAYKTRTTGVHPYVGFENAEKDRMHVIAGYGSGETELMQDGFDTEILDSSYVSFGAGGEMKLFGSDSILSGGTSELGIDGESWLVSQFVNSRSDAVGDLRVDVRHIRMALVGTHEHNLDYGATIVPEVSFGLREDGMKRQSFLGMEMGGGLGYSDNQGYSVSGIGEMLLNGTNQVQEWGVAGNLAYDSFGDQLGVLIEFTPAWGQVAATKDNVLWNQSILSHEFDSEMYTDGAKVDAEIGYGIRVWDDTGVLTPFGAVALTQNDGDEFGIGSRLQFGSDIELELEGIRSNLRNGSVEGEVRFDSSINW